MISLAHTWNETKKFEFADALFNRYKRKGDRPQETIKRVLKEMGPGHPNFMKHVLAPMMNRYAPIRDEEALVYFACLGEEDTDPLLQNSNTDTRAYSSWAHIMAQEARAAFESKDYEFETVLKRMGEMRQHQANAAQFEDYEKFGALRTSLLYTPHAGAYQPWSCYFADKLQETESEIILPNNKSRVIKTFHTIRSRSLLGHEVDGTHIVKREPNRRYFWWLSNLSPEKQEQLKSMTDYVRNHELPSPHPDEFRWLHTLNPEKIVQLKKMTNHILTQSFHHQELIRILAHWYHISAQAAVYKRGSSSITQILFVALCRTKRIKPPKALRLIDCWGLTLPMEEFRDQIFMPWFNGDEIPLVKEYQGLNNPNPRQT